MSGHDFVLVYPVWGSLIFLNLHIDIFHQIWEVFGCYFFKYLFYTNLSLLFGVTQILGILILSHRSLKNGLSLFSLFVFYILFLC